MKSFCVLSIGVSALLAVTLSLMAQAPDLNHRNAHPTIQVAKVPANPSTPTGILPVQYKAAYGFNRLANQGAGQTIAVVDAYDDPNIASDLAFYANYFHLTPCNFQKVKVGNPQEGQGWDLEESVGVEQVCALAPQANIILVEANSDSFSDLFNAVAVASSAPYNASVVSMAWGGAEFSGELQYDSSFCNILNGSGQPVTFVAATGGACGEPLYPAASSCVVAVGGTTLALSTAAPPANPLQSNYGVETAYGGGGISMFEPQPPWQNPACSQYSTQYRCVPDISAAANPGFPVYDTYSYGGWVEVEGTSVPTADWAAFFTLANSLRVSAGKSTLSQGDPDMYGIYYSSSYLDDFHDITTGGGGECQAGPGYDLATGIGSYHANSLAPALAADPN